MPHRTLATALALAAALVLAGCSATDSESNGETLRQTGAAAATPAASTPAASTSPASTKPPTEASDTATSRPRASAPPSSSAASPAARKATQPTPTKSAPAPRRTTSVPKPAPATGTYLAYSAWEGNRAKYADSDVVLFFHADWCPKCQDTDASAKAGMPAGLTLVKIDYDSATKLRQQYGVTLQHTFVQVNEAGGALKKWVGSYSDNSVAWVKAQTV